MEQCWTVEDNPRSRVCLFVFLISFFFLLHVERFSVALCFFRSLLKNGNYLHLPAEHPLFFTTDMNILLVTTSSAICAEKSVAVSTFGKSSEYRFSKKVMIFSFVTKNYFAFFRISHLVKLQCMALKQCQQLTLFSKKIQNNAQKSVFSRLSSLYTDILLPTLLAGYLIYLGISLVFVGKIQKPVVLVFLRPLVLLMSVIFSITKT